LDLLSIFTLNGQISNPFNSIKLLSSTQAKQSFGQLLEDAAKGPVAIERHGKVQAVVAAPRFFSADPGKADEIKERKLARLEQTLVEKNRLIRHQRIALDLATLPKVGREALIKSARAEVERWKRDQLCSADYIERWTKILALSPAAMATTITSDADGWGSALRQNSPWPGVHA